MPEIDNGSSMSSMTIRVGDTIKNATPSQEAQSRIGEKTSIAQTNTELEPQLETADEAVTQENGEDSDFVSGGAKARKLGESRRKLAKSLLDSAQSSDEARDNFKKLVQEDKELDKYFRKHFAAQYQTTVTELTKSSIPSENLDIELRTKASILKEDIQTDREDMAIDFAVQLHFTQDEADELKDMALKLEGTKVGGKELDFEDALKRAARIIRPDKAKVGITQLPSSRGLDDTKILQTQAKNEQLVDQMRGQTGYKPDKDKAMKNLEIVNQGYDAKNRRFVMPENLL
jgi:hypothetical protein